MSPFFVMSFLGRREKIPETAKASGKSLFRRNGFDDPFGGKERGPVGGVFFVKNRDLGMEGHSVDDRAVGDDTDHIVKEEIAALHERAAENKAVDVKNTHHGGDGQSEKTRHVFEKAKLTG